MSTLVGLQESRSGWGRPLAKPLDEALWQAWVAKGHAQDRRSSAARVKAVKWVSVAALLLTALFWRSAANYQLLLDFVVCMGAIVVVQPAVRANEYFWAAGLIAIAILFNPILGI
jgi:hypothetical protein